jgi:hypothetical protein
MREIQTLRIMWKYSNKRLLTLALALDLSIAIAIVSYFLNF